PDGELAAEQLALIDVAERQVLAGGDGIPGGVGKGESHGAEYREIAPRSWWLWLVTLAYGVAQSWQSSPSPLEGEGGFPRSAEIRVRGAAPAHASMRVDGQEPLIRPSGTFSLKGRRGRSPGIWGESGMISSPSGSRHR